MGWLLVDRAWAASGLYSCAPKQVKGWVDEKLMEFKQDKCQVLPLDKRSPRVQHSLGYA